MDSGNAAWLLISSALVLFMTPGLAFFYGGMVRSKNVLNMLMKNLFTIALITPLWVIGGYSLAFGNSSAGLIGDFSYFMFRGLAGEDLLFAMFQMTFAIITPALITGAVAERLKFSAYVWFASLWSLLVYSPVAHWVWNPDGWIFKYGALDFAGGLVVHVNAGVAALALVLVLGPRIGFGRDAIRPHSLPLTILGTGILWFGWFGFNAGSALAANEQAVTAMVATQIGASLGALGWVLAEWKKTGYPTTLGAASGAVAGLVAITPAAGFVSPGGAMAIGVLAGIVCFWAVGLKARFGYDDSLDVVGVHLVGGITGSLLVGLFAVSDGGLLYGGGVALLAKQVVVTLAVLVFSFLMSYALAKILDRTMGLRVEERQEVEGLDITLHEERGYILSE